MWILFHITNEKSKAKILGDLSKDTNLQNTRTCIQTHIIPLLFGLLISKIIGYLWKNEAQVLEGQLFYSESW